MKVLTDTVKDNDCSIDRITNNGQHTCDKGISYGNSGNRIEGKDNQNVMEKCKYCTACKADILEAEPDVKKHEDSSNDNGNYCISSHLIADSSGNALCLN